MASFPTNLFSPVAYRGALLSVPVALESTRQHQSLVVSVFLDWQNVYTKQAVYFNFHQQAYASSVLDRLLMAYVDNSNNLNNVYIYFPDTQQALTVLAGVVGYFPLITGRPECFVYNGTQGSNIALQGNTNIQFCNFLTSGFAVNDVTLPLVRIASTSGGTSQAYVPQSLGNLASNFNITWNGDTWGGVTHEQFSFLTGITTNDIIITYLEINVAGLYSNSAVGGGTLNISFIQGGVIGSPLSVWSLGYTNSYSSAFPWVQGGDLYVGATYFYYPAAGGTPGVYLTKSDPLEAMTGEVNFNFQYLLVPVGAG